MSLLADLLSKIKQPHPAGEIPPHLKNIVERSSKKSSLRKKLIVLSSIFIAAILSGYLLINFLNSLSSSSLQTDGAAHHALQDSNRATDSRGHETAVSEKSAIKTATEREEKTVPPSPPRSSAAQPGETSDQTINDIDAAQEANPEKVPSDREKKKRPPLYSAGTTTKKSRETDTASLLYRARAFEMKKDYSQALENYKSVLDRDKDNFTVMNNIAYILLQLGQAEASMEFSEKALSIKNTYVPALVNLGIAQAMSDQSDTAALTFQKAYSLAPENSLVLLNLAVLKERQYSYEEAAHFFNRLMNLGETAGYTGLARIYEKQEKTEEAINLYNEIALIESFDNKTRTEARQRSIMLQSRKRQAGDKGRN